MSDSPPRHESADNQGSTLQQSGVVGVADLSIPAVAGAPISEFIVQCPDDQDVNGRLMISLDGGVNFLTIQPAGHWAWTPKGASVTQIVLKGNQANVGYEVVLNREVD